MLIRVLRTLAVLCGLTFVADAAPAPKAATPALTRARVVGDRARPRDVRQGQLSDCFLLGTLASIASVQPEHIANAFVTTENGHLALDAEGRPSARFYVREGERRVEQIIQLDLKFPRDKNGALKYAQAPGGKLWAPLLEQGYGKLVGERTGRPAYVQLERGGVAGDVIFAVTGRASHFHEVEATPKGLDVTWEKLKAATEAGAIVVAGSAYEKDFDKRQEQSIASGLFDERAGRYTFDSQRLPANHVQSVLRVIERGRQRLVVLRNPWGYYTPRGNGRHDGTYKLSLEKFSLFYSDLTYSHWTSGG